MNVEEHLSALRRNSELANPTGPVLNETVDRSRRKAVAYLRIILTSTAGLVAIMTLLALRVPTTDTNCTSGTTCTTGSSGTGTTGSSGTGTTGSSGTTGPIGTGTPTPPPLSISLRGVDPPPNNKGWNNSNVRVTWSCTGGLNGAVEPVVGDVMRDEGTGLVAEGTCRDDADNKKTARYVLNIDKTPPQIRFSQDPPQNINGWNSGPVIVTWACTDALSGPVQPTASTRVAIEGTGLVAEGTCVDNADNNETAGYVINIDKTLPQIRFVSQDPPPNINGWNSGPVLDTWACIDSLSGPVQPTLSKRLATEGEHLITSPDCHDNAGHSSSSDVRWVRIDTTLPTTSIDTPSTPLLIRGIDSIHGTAQDGLSGVHRTTLIFTDRASGRQTERSSRLTCDAGCRHATWESQLPECNGLFSLTARSTDAADNVGRDSATIQVLVVGIEDQCASAAAKSMSTRNSPAGPVANGTVRVDAGGLWRYFQIATPTTVNTTSTPTMMAATRPNNSRWDFCSTLSVSTGTSIREVAPSSKSSILISESPCDGFGPAELDLESNVPKPLRL